MVRPRRPPAPFRPVRELAHLVWRVPLLALPFAAFFVLVSGSPLRAIWAYWRVAGAFALATMLVQWVMRAAVEPRVRERLGDDPRSSWWLAAMYLASSLFGAAAAALVLNVTWMKGFLGDPRVIAMLFAYTLLFGAAFTGAALAVNFYRRAMERAGSERELLLARRIQSSFLISEFPRRPRIEVHAQNAPSREVSGDFYDVVTPNEAETVLAIADVSGKGVPAALLSSMLQASLRTQAGSTESPAAMMAVLNRLVCQRVHTGQFATFFLAIAHEPTLTLRFTNAGHNFPVLQRADGTRELLERGGLVVGMLAEAMYEQESVRLGEGDRVIFYTDGVTEAARADGEMFGEQRLYALLDAAPRDASAAALVELVLAGVKAFLAGVEPGDDITVMALRVLPAAGGARG